MSQHPIVEVCVGGCPALLVVVSRPIEVGRECDGLLLVDPMASRRHLVLKPTGTGVVAEDLGSSNGTMLNGVLLDSPTRLGPGDELLVGDTTIRLSALTAGVIGQGSGPRAATVSPDDRGTIIRPSGAVAPALVRPTPQHHTDPDARSTSIEQVAADVGADTGTIRAVTDLGIETGGTLTFAFSDIESSTERAAAMGDRRWFEVLTRHNEIIQRLVEKHGGRVIKSVGDGFMLTFPSARRGLQASMAIQRAMQAAATQDPETGVRVRLGLHTGEAIESGGDLFGLHVNTAARVANLAGGGEITVSSMTRAITEPAGDLRFGPAELVVLKGLPGSHGVSRLLWEAPA